MKSFLLLSALLFCLVSSAQDYTFKKVMSSGQVVKIKGSVSITDNELSINTDGTVSKFPIVNTASSDPFFQYVSGDDVRISLDKKNLTLLLEIKDKFTNSVSSVTYFLVQ